MDLYEQKYKEALAKCKEQYQKCIEADNPIQAQRYVDIFPELTESEDERIRRALIEHVKGIYKGCCTEEACKERDMFIAWLEEQAQKPSEDEDREYACQSSEHYTRRELMIYNLGIGDGKRRIDDAIKETEQNSAWSEEDDSMYNRIVSFIPQHLTAESYTACINWLKSLKDRMQPQPKQEWSEEDENMRGDLLGYLNGFSVSETAKHQMFDWLKSLRPQNRWKPSDEQMKALKHAFNDCSIAFADMKILATLYEQLKALHRYEQDT